MEGSLFHYTLSSFKKINDICNFVLPSLSSFLCKSQSLGLCLESSIYKKNRTLFILWGSRQTYRSLKEYRRWKGGRKEEKEEGRKTFNITLFPVIEEHKMLTLWSLPYTWREETTCPAIMINLTGILFLFLFIVIKSSTFVSFCFYTATHSSSTVLIRTVFPGLESLHDKIYSIKWSW